MVIFTRTLAPKVITMVPVAVPVFLAISIVIAMTVVVVDPLMVVAVVITSWGAVRSLSSSHIFLDYLLHVVSVYIIFGSGEKLSDRGRPLPK